MRIIGGYVHQTSQRVIVLFARLALGIGFLSAVADRFGLWGPSGTRNVAWGDFQHFVQYTARLNPELPARVIRPLGVFVTVCEIAFGVALIAGVGVRIIGLLSGALLLAFAVGMSVGTGAKTALDASVFAASAASFLLASQVQHRKPNG